MDYNNIDYERTSTKNEAINITVVEEEQDEEKILEVVALSEQRLQKFKIVDFYYDKLYSIAKRSIYPLFDQLNYKDLMNLLFDFSDDIYNDIVNLSTDEKA